ncbi:hypothetical protein BV25DRAFT_1819550 [Artomyces pyxidatus]|uniref:Uncharacterized protein n=1 Tax=Artomyces pyxidatus TaxID=48021 RepID=A0ACB8TFP5_9AGAM|nr:hypothetical protein BV25DRAFT_1819550 [Artomyces pyxidatus]
MSYRTWELTGSRTDCQTIVAAVTAPLSRPECLLHVASWIWIHLLQFTAANQTILPNEDAANKSYRPIPSGRITHRNAVRLRWLLLPLCTFLSALYGVEVLGASVAVSALTFAYNEMGGHKTYYWRDSINAVGFCSFEAGAMLLAGPDARTLDHVEIWAICLNAAVYATTIHAQDFRDEQGDRALGRTTVPLALPSIGRYVVLVALLAWSAGVSFVWRLDFATASAFCMLGLYIGIRFVSLKTVTADQVSFYWYNVWVTLAHSLAGYYRLHGQME